MRALLGIGIGVVAAVSALPVAAQGHGPVYGLSTPTLGRGGWSLDVAGMGRFFDGGRKGKIGSVSGNPSLFISSSSSGVNKGINSASWSILCKDILSKFEILESPI